MPERAEVEARATRRRRRAPGATARRRRRRRTPASRSGPGRAGPRRSRGWLDATTRPSPSARMTSPIADRRQVRRASRSIQARLVGSSEIHSVRTSASPSPICGHVLLDELEGGRPDAPLRPLAEQESAVALGHARTLSGRPTCASARRPCAPCAGIIVTLRCTACSGSGSAASRSRRRAIVSQHHALLGHRQRGAEAAADAAAERDPLVGAGLVADPALGPEGERVGVDVLAVVDEQDAHRHRRVGRRRAYSPSRHGTVTRRPMIGITGRERMRLV